MINQQGLNLIIESEGFSEKPYMCPAGVCTIGFGSTVYFTGSPVRMTDNEITKAQAYSLLCFHVEKIEKKICLFLDSINLKLNENQLSALLSFAYNLGTSPILKEGRSVHEALKKRNHKAVADSLLLYDKITDHNGTKQVSNGLQKRRKLERELYLS